MKQAPADTAVLTLACGKYRFNDLDLGIRNIYLGPTLPAFVSPGVLNFLVENYGIRPVTTPETDLAEILN